MVCAQRRHLHIRWIEACNIHVYVCVDVGREVASCTGSSTGNVEQMHPGRKGCIHTYIDTETLIAVLCRGLTLSRCAVACGDSINVGPARMYVVVNGDPATGFASLSAGWGARDWKETYLRPVWFGSPVCVTLLLDVTG